MLQKTKLSIIIRKLNGAKWRTLPPLYIHLTIVSFSIHMIKKYPGKWILRKKVLLWVTSHYHGEIKEAEA